MENHISLLLVVVPLIAAPVVAVLPRGRLPWAVAFIVAALCAVLAGMQLWAVVHEGAISYELGGWAPPWGIEYRIDAVNAFVALIVAAIAAITLPYALLSAEREIPEEKIPLFYSAMLLCLTGLLGITQTGDIFNVICLSGDIITLLLCADQPWKTAAGIHRRLSIPDHGHDRRHLLFDRRGPDLFPNRQPEYAGSGNHSARRAAS